MANPAARIYRPAKSAMTSGRKKTAHWILEFEPTDRQAKDPLMGWAGSGDTRGQVRLQFESQEAAIGYAKRAGLDYQIAPLQQRSVKPKSYADNFRA